MFVACVVVIGKGGEQIGNIQMESDCKVQFAPGLLFLLCHFLPLDKAIASRAVFVIVSQAGGKKSFWSQLNNSKKRVRDRPYDVSMGS